MALEHLTAEQRRDHYKRIQQLQTSRENAGKVASVARAIIRGEVEPSKASDRVEFKGINQPARLAAEARRLASEGEGAISSYEQAERQRYDAMIAAERESVKFKKRKQSEQLTKARLAQQGLLQEEALKELKKPKITVERGRVESRVYVKGVELAKIRAAREAKERGAEARRKSLISAKQISERQKYKYEQKKFREFAWGEAKKADIAMRERDRLRDKPYILKRIAKEKKLYDLGAFGSVQTPIIYGQSMAYKAQKRKEEEARLKRYTAPVEKFRDIVAAPFIATDVLLEKAGKGQSKYTVKAMSYPPFFFIKPTALSKDLEATFQRTPAITAISKTIPKPIKAPTSILPEKAKGFKKFLFPSYQFDTTAGAILKVPAYAVPYYGGLLFSSEVAAQVAPAGVKKGSIGYEKGGIKGMGKEFYKGVAKAPTWKKLAYTAGGAAALYLTAKGVKLHKITDKFNPYALKAEKITIKEYERGVVTAYKFTEKSGAEITLKNIPSQFATPAEQIALGGTTQKAIIHITPTKPPFGLSGAFTVEKVGGASPKRVAAGGAERGLFFAPTEKGTGAVQAYIYYASIGEQASLKSVWEGTSRVSLFGKSPSAIISRNQYIEPVPASIAGSSQIGKKSFTFYKQTAQKLDVPDSVQVGAATIAGQRSELEVVATLKTKIMRKPTTLRGKLGLGDYYVRLPSGEKVELFNVRVSTVTKEPKGKISKIVQDVTTGKYRASSSVSRPVYSLSPYISKVGAVSGVSKVVSVSPAKSSISTAPSYSRPKVSTSPSKSSISRGISGYSPAGISTGKYYSPFPPRYSPPSKPPTSTSYYGRSYARPVYPPSSPPPIPPISPPPTAPPPKGGFFPRFDEPKRKKKKKSPFARQPKEYTPSGFALLTARFGKPTLAGIKTGAGIRPILKK